MIKYFFLFLPLIACAQTDKEYETYGEVISTVGAVSTDTFLAQVGEKDEKYKVQGVIEEVCQMKGCWMTLKTSSGQTVRITFKDYGFFVPKDVSGKEVIIEGMAVKEEIDEEAARHYADDSGKEYDPSMRNTITFVASGVLIAKG